MPIETASELLFKKFATKVFLFRGESQVEIPTQYKYLTSCIFRYNENGEVVFTETEVINHKEIKTNSVSADLSSNMQTHQSVKHSRRKQRSRERKQRLSRKRKSRQSSEVLVLSENICNMTITREVIESGHCSSFGSFCNIFQTDRFRHSEVIHY